jgi:hypothetical protein
LFIAASHSFCVANPALVSRRRSSVSQLASAPQARLERAALDPVALLAVVAALRRVEANIDDVLPRSGAFLAAVWDRLSLQMPE